MLLKMENVHFQGAASWADLPCPRKKFPALKHCAVPATYAKGKSEALFLRGAPCSHQRTWAEYVSFFERFQLEE
jgi:hypothetical protein